MTAAVIVLALAVLVVLVLLGTAVRRRPKEAAAAPAPAPSGISTRTAGEATTVPTKEIPPMHPAAIDHLEPRNRVAYEALAGMAADLRRAVTALDDAAEAVADGQPLRAADLVDAVAADLSADARRFKDASLLAVGGRQQSTRPLVETVGWTLDEGARLVALCRESLDRHRRGSAMGVDDPAQLGPKLAKARGAMASGADAANEAARVVAGGLV